MTFLLVIGVFAGALTTVSGFGGGLLLVLVLALTTGVRSALAVSALALLVGNAHRLWLYRQAVAWSVVRPLALGIVPGALFGALALSGVAPIVVSLLMVFAVGMSVLRLVGGFTWVLPPTAMTASGVVIGLLVGATGSAALLVGPLLLAAGLSGEGYLATVAVTSLVMHGTRLVGYVAGGAVGDAVVPEALLLAAALVVGNLLGDAVRAQLSVAQQRAIEVVMPVVGMVLALAGMA